jgi:putative peptidoglycan lipid II flippase
MSPATATKKKAKVSIGNAAALLVAASLIGQLLGFLRVKLINSNFPTTGPQGTDAYFAAFSIPDFFFFTVAAGALGVALMPVLSDRLHSSGKKSVWELSTSVMNLMAIAMAIVAFIIVIFARPLIEYVVAPGLSPEQTDVSVQIMRLLAFNPLLFTISGIITSTQQTFGRFFFFAVAPLFYNVSIIVSIFIFRDNIGIVGLGIGALVGAIIQLLVVMIGVWKTSFSWRPLIRWKSPDFQIVMRNLPPRALDQGVDQVNSIVETNIASGLGAGSISNYSNAYVLSNAPVMLVGTAISTAAFPRLNARLSQHRPDLFRKDFLMVLRAMIWISAPIVVIGFFTRGYLARLIYARGNQEIAIIFGFLSLAIFFRILYSIISRWFYAQKDTRTPLFVSLFTIGLNIVLAYMLAKPNAYGVAGLALAASIVATIEVFILSAIMLIRDPKLFDMEFWTGVLKIVSVTGFSVVAGFIMISLYPLGAEDKGIVTLGTKLLLVTAVTFSVHIIISALFGLEEVRPIIRRLKKLVLSPIKIYN